MTTLNLVSHPATPCGMDIAIGCDIRRAAGDRLALHYAITGDIADLEVPTPKPGDKYDGLWKTTCFELFFRVPGEDRYGEFNLSPSSQWAAYQFTSHRVGSVDMDLPWFPQIVTHRGAGELAIDAEVPLIAPWAGAPLDIGITTVIEEADGRLSYWALAHPPEAPDFHHPTCFVHHLQAAA